MDYRHIVTAAMLMGLSGCTTYIEKPTPTAAIPPVPPIQQPQIQEIPRTAPGEPLGTAGIYDAQMNGGGMAAGTISRFRDAYAAAKKPRIAIFLNRTLSDDVREWRTVARATVSGDGMNHSRETALGRSEDHIKGNAAVSLQLAGTNTGARISPNEEYVWQFEDGFMQPFLKGGATVVDRAVILRLTSRGENQKFDAAESKRIEMDALVNHADILVEVLITRSPSAPTGYEFKATAKETRTGRILANATSLNWNMENRPKKIVTTASGYEIIDDPAFPKIQLLSGDLALDLMNMLTTAWGGR